MIRPIRPFCYALATLFLLAFVLPAQAQFKASMQGTITDAKGGAVAGAKVTIVNQETGVSRDTVSAEEGFYRIALLPPGKYTVTVEATGFKKSVTKDVVVEAEQPRGFDVPLQVGAVQESVTVTASTEALQTENANTAGTMSAQEIQRLPRSEEHTSELQSRSDLVCRLLLEKKKNGYDYLEQQHPRCP